MTISREESKEITKLVSEFLTKMGELGADAAVVVFSYELNSEAGRHFVMERGGIGSPFARAGMLQEMAEYDKASAAEGYYYGGGDDDIAIDLK